jgi:hypothetical protein
MELFKIGDEDFTNLIQVPSYKVNNKPVYNTWTDADYIDHRDIVREKIRGSFRMLIDSDEDLLRWLTAISNYTTSGGYVPVTLYVDNLAEQCEADMYIDFDIPEDRPYYGNKKHDPFEVKLEER